jgi:hypothetical protein
MKKIRNSTTHVGFQGLRSIILYGYYEYGDMKILFLKYTLLMGPYVLPTSKNCWPLRKHKRTLTSITTKQIILYGKARLSET